MTTPTEREVLEALFFGVDRNLLSHKERLFSERPEGYSEAMHRANRFTAMLDAGAYLDAALMLVPKGFVWTVMTDFGGLRRARVYGSVLPSQVPDRSWQADGATPALALCAAIEASLAREGG